MLTEFSFHAFYSSERPEKMINRKTISFDQEDPIRGAAVKYLKQGRPGDVAHTRTVVTYEKASQKRYSET